MLTGSKFECHAFKCGCEGEPGWHEAKYERQLQRQRDEKFDYLMTGRKQATYTDYTKAIEEVSEEYFKARENFPDFRSRHEGIAIIEEEFLEFRDAAMWPHKNKGDSAYEEAKQLAAMSIRYMVDIGRE